MKPDAFESQLAQQPPRTPPAAWREAILQAATPRRVSLRRLALGEWWRELFWPSPLAWAGVVALWVATGLLNLSAPRMPEVLAFRHNGPTAGVRMVLAEQRAWLEEIVPPPAPAPAPVALPRPRSECPRRVIPV